jgi:hypothetical protein
MGCMRAHEPKNEQSCFVSRDASSIKRYRNPLGIFSRAFIYPLIGFGACQHRLELVVAGAALEVLLWTALPPVEETFGFVEDAIETELDWLNALSGPQKSLSFALLALFPHRRVRGPVEALLASARRVHGPHHRLLLLHASCRREVPIVRVDLVNPSAWRNCLENSRRGSRSCSLGGTRRRNTAPPPPFPTRGPRTGGFTDFPDSFVGSVLGSQRLP